MHSLTYLLFSFGSLLINVTFWSFNLYLVSQINHIIPVKFYEETLIFIPSLHELHHPTYNFRKFLNFIIFLHHQTQEKKKNSTNLIIQFKLECSIYSQIQNPNQFKLMVGKLPNFPSRKAILTGSNMWNWFKIDYNIKCPVIIFIYKNLMALYPLKFNLDY